MAKSLDLMVYKVSTEGQDRITEWPDSVMGFKCIDYKPKLFSLGKYRTDPFINFMWYIACLGRFRILLLSQGDLIVHSVYVTSKTYRFPYMGKNDINIGQAMTLPDFRGQGIGTELFRIIIGYFADKQRYLWANCAPNNIASQRVFSKMGMQFAFYAKMSLVTKVIRTVKTL